MAVPKKRTTSRKGKLRRTGSYPAVTASLSKCANCSVLVRPHTICWNCGTYNKVKVNQPKSKVKRSKKGEEKTKDGE